MRENIDFLTNKFSFGLIIRSNLEAIEDIKKYIAEHENISVIFQKISTNKLWIKEGGDTHE